MSEDILLRTCLEWERTALEFEISIRNGGTPRPKEIFMEQWAVMHFKKESLLSTETYNALHDFIVNELEVYGLQAIDNYLDRALIREFFSEE